MQAASHENHAHYTRLSADHARQMERRGLSPQIIEAAGLHSALPARIAEILGFKVSSNGIVIPFHHPLTDEVVLNRVRPDIPPTINNKLAKYLSPKGATNHFYFPPGAKAWLRDPSIPIAITEGELKTLWATQAGFRCVGSIGVQGWLGKGGPIADLDLIAWEDRHATIVFDSDVATNERVKGARQSLAFELYRRGAKEVSVVDLPDDDSGAKVGWDDFLLHQGVDAFLDLESVAIPSSYPRVKLWTGADLRAAHIERPPAIVKAWGIRQKGKAILTGAGGRGKSTLLLQLACDLAAGTPLLGHGPLIANGPQRVAVYMAEDPLSEVKFRWEQQMAALRYSNDVAQRIAFLDAQGAKLMFTDGYGRTALFAALRRHQAAVCILDPLVALHNADENSNDAMRRVLDLLTPFQEETGCTFLIAHHEPKAPESNSAASRGASAIRDWCRTMLRLSSQKAGSEGTQRFQLDLDKANYGGTVWNLTLERKKDSYLFLPIEPEAAVTPKDIWEVLGVEGAWLDTVQDLVKEQFAVSPATANRAIKKAEELHLVERREQVNPETNRKKSYLTRGTGTEGET